MAHTGIASCPVTVCILLGALIVLNTSSAQPAAAPEGFARWKRERQALAADPGVVAYYDFQEGKGDVLRNRSQAGADLDGAIRGAQWADGRWPGKKALQFDGLTNLVEIPAVDTLCALDQEKGGSGEMTIEVWLKATSSKEAGIVDPSSAGWAKDAPYMIWVSPNRLSAYLGMQPENRVTKVNDSEEVITGDWTHVVMVADAESLALYRDGVLLGRRLRGDKISDNGRPRMLGAMGDLPEGRFYFSGLLDEVVIYNKALPEAAVKARAELVAPPTGLPSITLNSPRAGDRWYVGRQHRITWGAVNLRKGSTLKIESTADDGETWQQISAAARNTSEFLWRVPETVSEACRIRISVNGLELVTQTDGSFAIDPPKKIPYQWVKVVLPAAFAPRDGAGGLVYKDRMWLLGGWNPNDKKHFPQVCNNEVWNSVDGAEWTLVKPNTHLKAPFDVATDWEGRHTAGYAVFKERMWIVGGDANQGHYQNDVWSSADGKKWECATDNVPWGPRVLHYTVAFKNKLWVIGGQTLPQFAGGVKEIFYDDVWCSRNGVDWEEVEVNEPHWPQRGMIGGFAVFKGRMWILGGGTYDTPKRPKRKFFNDVWSSADGSNWTCHVENAPWHPRQYHEVAVFDGKLWVMEGCHTNGRNRNDVWYSADGVEWHELPDTPWPPRHAATVFVYDNALWMVTGNNMQSDVWKLVRTVSGG